VQIVRSDHPGRVPAVVPDARRAHLREVRRLLLIATQARGSATAAWAIAVMQADNARARVAQANAAREAADADVRRLSALVQALERAPVAPMPNDRRGRDREASTSGSAR